MKNIKAIVFDLGGVILNIDYQNTIQKFKLLGVKNTEDFYSKKSQSNLFNQFEKGEISKKKFFAELQQKAPLSSTKELKDAWNSMLLDLPSKRIDILKKISLNYSIFLLSNTNNIHISKFKQKIGKTRYNEFYELFSKVYYSHEIGMRKPESRVFKLVLTENNLSSSEVLFIDDSIQHIESAQKLGIKTYHLSNNEDISTLLPDIFL